MPYQVKFTETTNPAKPSITVEDQSLNNSTSLQYPGKNYAGYAPVIAENFLHLLENFARNTPPERAVQGQLWYDNSAGVNLLKVYDGTQWTPAGTVKKADTAPPNSLIGDLWVDKINKQLFVYSGSNWLLVGPQFSSGLKTGPEVETIVDTSNVENNVISLYADNNRVAIVSKNAFTPKQTITGFTTIGQGLNLSTVDSTSTTAPTKFWGTASKADALVVNGNSVSASNFLRSDTTSTSNAPINIRNNAGLSIGSDLSFNILTDTNGTILYNKTSGNSVSVRLNNAGTPVTGLYINSDAKIGLGLDNTNPQEILDVSGNALIDGTVTVIDTTNATVLGGTASITTSGGLNVDRNIIVGGDHIAYGGIHLNNLDINGDPEAGTVIQPGSDSANMLYDIGSSTRKFRNIYAQSFVGNFSGVFTGGLTGDVNGSANKLASATNFSITGDISSNTIAFDGEGDDPAVFTATVTQDIINGKTNATDTYYSDMMLIYRPGVGLRKSTKQVFVSNIPTVPVGAIMPFAGAVPPTGYLLCDGSEVKIGDYPDLFGVVEYRYKVPAQLLGQATFALPDLRGRFPLGADNMNNNVTVPSVDDPTIQIPTITGPANRVTDITADTLGTGSGAEARTLEVENLPDHKHNLNSGNAQYFASGLPGAPADSNAVPNQGMPLSSTGSGLPNSGNVISPTIGQPFVTMNPYLTINYIIFTGKIA